ncbi:MAG TPA: hypothetical protein DCO65_00185 [Spartobacteria bacterium]|jgi:hypothetical protein|nr:hypothetical protein [Spartobacteria bacterium]
MNCLSSSVGRRRVALRSAVFVNQIENYQMERPAVSPACVDCLLAAKLWYRPRAEPSKKKASQ